MNNAHVHARTHIFDYVTASSSSKRVFVLLVLLIERQELFLFFLNF